MKKNDPVAIDGTMGGRDWSPGHAGETDPAWAAVAVIGIREMNLSTKLYLIFNHLRHAWREQQEDFESGYLAVYGHPNAAEYLFLRHLYDLLPFSGPGGRYLSCEDRFNYVLMYPPHIWDCDGDVGIDRGGFRVVTMDHDYALELLNSPAKMPPINIARAVDIYVTDLSGRGWARTLELILDHEHHFLTPMAWKRDLVQHFLASFHPQTTAAGQPAQAAGPDRAPALPAAGETPKMTLDMELIGKIDQQDVWI